MAIQIGIFQHPLAVIAANVEVPFDDDAVLRERAGLIGAQDIHRAEILDRVEALHDHALF